MRMNPYLNFDGDCEEAFRYYERVLGGEIEAIMKHGDSPIAGEVPSDWHGMVLHACLKVGDQTLMASDSPPGHHRAPGNMYVSLHIEDASEAERVFVALADNGTVHMPFEKTFWAERFGMLTDRFGTNWMVNCEQPS